MPTNTVSLRNLLRMATEDIHNRLHHHPAFEALAAGTINPIAYRMLLERLYGFYTVLESFANWAKISTEALRMDLRHLGANDEDLLTISRCSIDFSYEQLMSNVGVRYVIEGSKMGGQTLTRSLSQSPHVELHGAGTFFGGGGARTVAASWKDFLAELEQVRTKEFEQTVKAACATFASFEKWMAGWDGDCRDLRIADDSKG